MNKAKQEIEEYVEKKVETKKYQATERAVARLDKYSRQEIQDNDWLKREVVLNEDLVLFCLPTNVAVILSSCI